VGKKKHAKTGSAGALARRSVRSTLNLNLPDADAVSRFALIAGEGARVPSTNWLVPDWIEFLGKAYRSRPLPVPTVLPNEFALSLSPPLPSPE